MAISFMLFVAIVLAVAGGIIYTYFVNIQDSKKKEESSEDEASGAPEDAGSQGRRRHRKKHLTSAAPKFAFDSPDLITSFKGHTAPITSAAVSSTGRGLMTAAPDQTIFTYNVHEAYAKRTHSIQGSRNNVRFERVSKLCWSPDYTAILCHMQEGGALHVMKGVRKTDGTLGGLNKHRAIGEDHTATLAGLGVASTGRFIMTCSEEAGLAAWDLKGGLLGRAGAGRAVTAALLSPDGRCVAVCGADEKGKPVVTAFEVVFSDAGVYENVVKMFVIEKDFNGKPVYGADFNSDSSAIVTVCGDGFWRLYDVTKDRKRGYVTSLRVCSEEISALLGSEGGGGVCVRLSPDQRMVLVSVRASVYCYSAVNGSLVHQVDDIYQGDIKDVFFDNGSKYFITVGDAQPRLFHNIAGYKLTIQELKDSLQAAGYAGLKERITSQLKETEATLKSIYAEKSAK